MPFLPGRWSSLQSRLIQYNDILFILYYSAFSFLLQAEFDHIADPNSLEQRAETLVPRKHHGRNAIYGKVRAIVKRVLL